MPLGSEFNWEFNAMLANNQPMTTKGRETQVLKKTDKGWRIVHVHYSAPITPPAQWAPIIAILELASTAIRPPKRFLTITNLLRSIVRGRYQVWCFRFKN